MKTSTVRRDIYVSMWGEAKADAYLAEEGRQQAIAAAESRKQNTEAIVAMVSDMKHKAAPPMSSIGAPQSAATGTSCAGWSLIKPKRFPGYRRQLFDFLRAQYIAGKPCPRACDVLDAWRFDLPPGIVGVMIDGVKYCDSNGMVKEANPKSIQQAIAHLTGN